MWLVLSVCFVVVTSVVGITELLRKLWLSLLRPREDPARVMVVFLKNDICVQQLRSAMEYLAWEGDRQFCCVAAVDCGLSEENRRLIAAIADQNSNVVFGDRALADCIGSFTARNTLGREK